MIMENIYEFLFRSSIAIGLFYLIYWLFLRQSTHFKANRIFMIFALCASIFISIFPLQYDVFVDNTPSQGFLNFNGAFNSTEEIEGFELIKENGFSIQTILFSIYLIGVAIFLIRLLVQSWKPIQIIVRNRVKLENKELIIENNIFALPFSFFNYIFINPNHHKQEELTDIFAHENVHIRERHWIDLLIIELLTVIFWFNPFIWFFEHSIKQNHEYLADEGVLSRGQTPVRYQALLVNQLMGMQVIGLSNSLHFALGPNRLKMMTKQKTSKRKLLRLAWGIPVLAGLLLAFAKPNYQSAPPVRDDIAKSRLSEVKDEKIMLKGTVKDEKGEPLPGASIVVKGGTHGAVSDLNGKFKFEVPKKGTVALVASFVGMETVSNALNVSDAEKVLDYEFIMKESVIMIDTKIMFLEGDVPPPPPPPVQEKLETDDDVFFVVEELPQYSNGYYGLGQYVKKRQLLFKKKFAGTNRKLSGIAIVGFTVTTNGEVANIQILKKTSDDAAKALYSIVKGMEKWSPGKQRGKAVSVNYAMELEF